MRCARKTRRRYFQQEANRDPVYRGLPRRATHHSYLLKIGSQYSSNILPTQELEHKDQHILAQESALLQHLELKDCRIIENFLIAGPIKAVIAE